MSHLPEFASVQDLYWGRDPFMDAWLLHFMTENNIEHSVDPHKNASTEQIRFMVVLEENQVFVPCSDWMLRNLLHADLSEELFLEYKAMWRAHAKLISEFIPDKYLRRKIVALCRHKFNKVLKSSFLIPSRLSKHLSTIVLTQSGLEDPLREKKMQANMRVKRFIENKSLDRLLNTCPETHLSCQRIRDVRWGLDLLELRRLFTLSTMESIWSSDDFEPNWEELSRWIDTSIPEFDAIITQYFGPGRTGHKKVLYIPETSGGIIFDILIIQSLLRLGHKVVLALKEEFHFFEPAFWDLEHCKVIREALEGAYFVEANNVSKNELLQIQRENPFVVISDGTRERLNLYRTSVTFARAWKEADLVIAKGDKNFRRLFLTSHEFTRDVLSIFSDASGQLRYYFKARSPKASHYSEAQILEKADGIIREMRKAKETGQKVMFYSAIIGSVPGQTTMALRILNRFVKHLRQRMEQTFIINPAEHFELGLDGDDLMFMWEKVQRSGLIDVWRFQSVSDIEKSFELLGDKVPPVWNGKDATFSTGCTKEMKIALDVQKRHPEMQIIGPSPEKFFRRREYGVGKFFDAAIAPVDRLKRS